MILNIYVPNNRTSNNMKPKSVDLKEIPQSQLKIFNTSDQVKKNINDDRGYLNKTINYLT